MPLLREDRVEGVFVLGAPSPALSRERQIELVQTFADQAVIAIENVRLFDEVQARTRDLEEALQQQTATADVLKVISRSAFDLQAVLDALVETALHAVRAPMTALILLRDGDGLRFAAHHGSSRRDVRNVDRRDQPRARRSSIGSRHARDLAAESAHIPTCSRDRGYGRRRTHALACYRCSRCRCCAKARSIGVIVLGAPSVGHSPSARSNSCKTFADQAVIAIENVRLFDEVQARTRDLTEALQQQTATADVLKVISRSAFDLQTVLETLVSTAVRLVQCDAGANLSLSDGDVFRHDAVRSESIRRTSGTSRRRPEIRPGRGHFDRTRRCSGKVDTISSTPGTTRNMRKRTRLASATCAPCSAYRYCGTVNSSAPLRSGAASRSRSLSAKSNLSRPLPIRP